MQDTKFYDIIKAKDYSGENVLGYISSRDTGIIENQYGITLNYVEPIYPSISDGDSVNTPVSAEAVSELREIVAIGEKQRGYAIDEAAVSLGEWGTTYHYTITVTNTTDYDRTAVLRCRIFNNMTFGYKIADEENYQTQFEYGKGAGDDDWWEPVSYTVPANDEITFEVVTTLGVSFGGTTYQFVVR